MIKMSKDRYSELYEIDGVKIHPNTREMEKQKIHVVISRQKELWEISLTSEKDDIMLMVPFNQPLKSIIEELLRLSKKNGENG